MQNFKVTYVFDGYKFFDVVNAADLESAFAYLKWIDDESSYQLLKAESGKTAQNATFYCPAGWTKPESVERARNRSLLTALANAGITDIDNYSEELNDTMQQLGYTATTKTNDSLYAMFGFGEPEIVEYTRHGSVALIVSK